VVLIVVNARFILTASTVGVKKKSADGAATARGPFLLAPERNFRVKWHSSQTDRALSWGIFRVEALL